LEPPLGDDALEHVDELLSIDRVGDMAGDPLVGELVDHVGDLQLASFPGLIELEVDRPHMVGVGRQDVAR